MPSTKAIVVMASKYMSARTPTRPTFERSPAAAIPCTTTQNTITGTSILMSLMKPSPSGFI
jgi:hypothetical protein